MKTILRCLAATLILASLTGCFRTRADIAREQEERETKAALQQSAVEHSQQMERLQAEIGRLQGKIEEVEHQRRKEMGTLSSSLNTDREGTDKRVSDLQGRLEETQKSQTALFDELKRLKEENVALLKAQAEKARHSGVAKPAGKKVGTQQYEAAVAAYKAKDYGSAIPVFRAFLESQPRSKRAVDANFFLGDSLYRTKEYSEAIIAFGAVHEKDSGSALGRRATLRIAESFKALGKDKDAKAFAQILVQSHPNSDEAKKARKLLQ